ncbi:MAG: ABC transporter substrate-binding protein [Cyanobacteria bacterium]|nr:ABC transporter substrate-binding protein [Cyanobacteriota bacterium]MDW8200035.1 ABC transporter substrate-binding protein [Cyanobacteriota bacterium SKYGB_h_bin112]
MKTLGLRQFATTLLIGASLVAVSGCQQTAEAPSSPAASPAQEVSSPAAPTEKKDVKFTLAWLLQGTDAPITLAIDKGYFAAEGLNVTFERGYGSADTPSKVAAGQYDIGTGDIYNMIEFNEKNPDKKLVAFAVFSNGAPFAIATLADSGIKTPKDLAGKKLGAPAGDAPRRLWPVFATSVGIPPDSVEWVTMEPKLRETFLLQKQVDAISGFVTTFKPNLVKAGKKDADIVVFYFKDYGLPMYGNVLFAREDFIKKNPDVIKAFTKAVLKGMKDTIADPDAALKSVLKASQQPMDEAAERMRLEIALNNLYVNDEVKKNGLFGLDPERMQKTIDQTVKGFGLKTTPKVTDVFDDSFLPPKEERMLQ